MNIILFIILLYGFQSLIEVLYREIHNQSYLWQIVALPQTIRIRKFHCLSDMSLRRDIIKMS